MSKLVKLADIAKPLGVSTVTVSKALSGQKGVSEDMRQKIIALADELGYKQPSAMRRLCADESYNIGVIIHEGFLGKYDSFYLQVYQSVNLRAVSKGCFTLLETVTQEMEHDGEFPQLVKEKKIDGLIVIGKLGEHYLELLKSETGIPMMYVDFCDSRGYEDSVISDSFYGAYCLTQYLMEKGHNDIAYVGTLLSTGSITDRYLGYVKCLMEHGISPRDDWKIDDRFIGSEKIEEDRLLKLPEQMPTAFFCNCDLTASILIRKLESAGYRVPQDISVVGYDNYLYPGLCDVEVTTYEVDIREMSRIAVDTLIKKISGEKYRTGLYIVEGHLVEKNSVKTISSDF